MLQPLLSSLRAWRDAPDLAGLPGMDAGTAVDAIRDSEHTLALVERLAHLPAFDDELGDAMARAGALRATPSVRGLRSCLGQPVASFTAALADIVSETEPASAAGWRDLAQRVSESPDGQQRLADLLASGALATEAQALLARLERDVPHAVYPTSVYRESSGAVTSADEGTIVEATMTSRTYTSVRIAEGVLEPGSMLLADVYRAHRRCVALIDQNVNAEFGDALDAYFRTHGISLEPIVVRAMEVDKAIGTVERILGSFKEHRVARDEPVLIVGGGVLADIGGLACALYHRSTPYVMIGTSIVSGIDAGPSPRTCCDGFGFKNLFGAYHAPALSITDRTFFRTLREGWLRHGVAEIIKMATVKDARLFEDLEAAGIDLVRTRFATVGEDAGSDLTELSRRILGGAMSSYVQAEYGNLYETHQARPHAYGHTWSPGFEIEAGLLHGHAVGIGMGFGAFLAERRGWITEAMRDRVHDLIETFEISLWSDALQDHDLLWRSQQKMIDKRGGVLAAPVPRRSVGACGYLDEPSEVQLRSALRDYEDLCRGRARGGVGVEPLCADVGLEDPSTVFVDPERDRRSQPAARPDLVRAV